MIMVINIHVMISTHPNSKLTFFKEENHDMRMTLTTMMLKMTIVNVGLAPIPAHIYILKP